MILPHPETDLRLNILVLGAELVEVLHKRANSALVEDLMQEFLNNDDRRTPELFFNTATFLYLIGLVDIDNYRINYIEE